VALKLGSKNKRGLVGLRLFSRSTALSDGKGGGMQEAEEFCLPQKGQGEGTEGQARKKQQKKE